MKHRFLTVKKASDMNEQQWDQLVRMFDYLPELRTLWNFARKAHNLFEKEARVQTLGAARKLLL